MGIVVFLAVAGVALVLFLWAGWSIKRKYAHFRADLDSAHRDILTAQKALQETVRSEAKQTHAALLSQRAYLDTQLINTYRQLEAHQVLAKLLPQTTLSGLRGWALSPDALLAILTTILESKPRVIVELGSGASTVAITDLIAQYRIKSTLISVDHSPDYLQQTISKVKNRQHLEPVLAKIKPQKFAGMKKRTLWYDAAAITKQLGSRDIDLLLIDGPPESTDDQARLPAYHALAEHLAARATILLDDYDRPDEQTAVADWLAFDSKQGPKLESIETEKGLAKITRKAD